MTIALSHKIDPAKSDRRGELREPYWQGLEADKLTNFAPEWLGAT